MRYIEEKIISRYPEGVKKDSFQPMLYGYLQDRSPELKNSKTRKAVIICPGGAYRFKSDREGEPIAMRFLAAGMQAFVLQYSVAPSQYPAALLELAEAVVLLRKNAEEWDIDPEQIMICGFSAGGHLCASLGTLWKDPVISESMDCSEYLWKPDGMILCYPVISMAEYGHEESRQLLMGDRISEELSERLSLQNQVSDETISTFIWSTQEDEQVPVENTLMFAAALQKHHVVFELHIYEKGEHGLALCDSTTEDKASQVMSDNADWITQAIRLQDEA